MIQIKALSGFSPDTLFETRRYPVRIGRDAQADFRLEATGVWEQHAQIELDPTEGFSLRSRPDAPVLLNGEPVQRSPLRNGDRIDIGSVKLQFWLSPPRQAGLRWREVFTWLLIAGVSLAQVCLIYLLIN